MFIGQTSNKEQEENMWMLQESFWHAETLEGIEQLKMVTVIWNSDVGIARCDLWLNSVSFYSVKFWRIKHSQRYSNNIELFSLSYHIPDDTLYTKRAK